VELLANANVPGQPCDQFGTTWWSPRTRAHAVSLAPKDTSPAELRAAIHWGGGGGGPGKPRRGWPVFDEADAMSFNAQTTCSQKKNKILHDHRAATGAARPPRLAKAQPHGTSTSCCRIPSLLGPGDDFKKRAEIPVFATAPRSQSSRRKKKKKRSHRRNDVRPACALVVRPEIRWQWPRGFPTGQPFPIWREIPRRGRFKYAKKLAVDQGHGKSIARLPMAARPSGGVGAP